MTICAMRHVVERLERKRRLVITINFYIVYKGFFFDKVFKAILVQPKGKMVQKRRWWSSLKLLCVCK